MKKVYLTNGSTKGDKCGIEQLIRKILRQKKLELIVPTVEGEVECENISAACRCTAFCYKALDIRTSDMLFAIISKGDNGESEVFWEIAYAYAKNVPVVVFCTDNRKLNWILYESAYVYLSTVKELEEYNFEKFEARYY